jgi:hypothetical protein
MSNLEDVNKLLDEVKDDGVDDATADLRVDDLKAAQSPTQAKPFVKPTIHVETKDVDGIFSQEQFVAISKMLEEKTRNAVREATFNSTMPGQMLPKDRVPITDFSKVTLDQVYDLDFPIEAKAFMSADVLAIQLKDTNYEARWVNKNPQNLGDKIAKGFTYLEPLDLISSDAIQTGVDAEGHYSFNDVVAMKIDKATYFRALRAAHERAVSTTNSANIVNRAAKGADSYMRKESGYGQDYGSASTNKKMSFYDPGIEA